MTKDFERNREARLASVKARRATEAFAASGAALVAKRQEEAREARRIERAKIEARRPVNEEEVRRFVRRIEASAEEAAQDSGLSVDEVFYDIANSVLYDARPALRREVRRALGFDR